MLKQLRQGLSKTRGHLSSGLKSLLLGRKEVDKYLLEDIETQLLSFDVGIEAANEIIKKIELHARDQNTSKPGQLIGLVKDQLESILEGCSAPLCTVKQHKPFVILTVGVNGAGKTTTIGKLAKRLQSQGQSVMLAAGDTFR